jgi:CRISPR-associated endoribonuclease Cas6
MTHSPDLYALIIRLVAGQDGRLRATQGHLAHAAFLNIIEQVDPALSAALHELDGRKPFTISPLEGYGRGHRGQIQVKGGQEGWLRVTLLDPALFHTFIHYFLQGQQRPAIQLDGFAFHISEILSTPGSHRLAGYDSLDTLYERWETADMAAVNEPINLHFRTPTGFSRRSSHFRHMHILPDPYFVFGELAGYWDRLTGVSWQEEVRNFAAQCLVVARHEIASHIYQYRHSKHIGFAGRVTYQVMEKTATNYMRHLQRLADLAFYTGVGSKTTMGMGQVVRIRN